MDKKPRAANRFTKQEIVEQETLAWRIKKQGATWKQVAEALTATASDGKPISESTAQERGKAALRHYRVERDEWDNQRREHLAEAEMVKEKLMQMLFRFNPDNGSVSELRSMWETMVGIQRRQDEIMGVPLEAPAPPPEGIDARSYVLNLIQHPEAHQNILTAVREAGQLIEIEEAS